MDVARAGLDHQLDVPSVHPAVLSRIVPEHHFRLPRWASKPTATLICASPPSSFSVRPSSVCWWHSRASPPRRSKRTSKLFSSLFEFRSPPPTRLQRYPRRPAKAASWKSHYGRGFRAPLACMLVISAECSALAVSTATPSARTVTFCSAAPTSSASFGAKGAPRSQLDPFAHKRLESWKLASQDVRARH